MKSVTHREIYLTGCMILSMLVTSTTMWAQGLENGDFSQSAAPTAPFANWATTLGGFAPPSDGGGFAVFDESGDLGSQLEQTFVLPVGAPELAFNFRLTAVSDGPVGFPVPDSFQASLFDAAGNPVHSAGDPQFFPAFFSIDNTAPGSTFFDSNFVQLVEVQDGWVNVSLNTQGLASDTYLLEFILNGGQDGFATDVELDDVRLLPEPQTLGMAIAAVSAFALLRRRLLKQRCGMETSYEVASVAAASDAHIEQIPVRR
jgi:hypothetical protein